VSGSVADDLIARGHRVTWADEPLGGFQAVQIDSNAAPCMARRIIARTASRWRRDQDGTNNDVGSDTMSETAADAILSIEQLTLALPATPIEPCRRGGLAHAAPAADPLRCR